MLPQVLHTRATRSGRQGGVIFPRGATLVHRLLRGAPVEPGLPRGWHPETKCADVNGEPANKQTVGLLHRRHISIDHLIYIGRESNQLEDVDAGLVRASDGYTEYPDSRRDYWQTAVVPALKQIRSTGVAHRAGLLRTDSTASRQHQRVTAECCSRSVKAGGNRHSRRGPSSTSATLAGVGRTHRVVVLGSNGRASIRPAVRQRGLGERGALARESRERQRWRSP